MAVRKAARKAKRKTTRKAPAKPPAGEEAASSERKPGELPGLSGEVGPGRARRKLEETRAKANQPKGPDGQPVTPTGPTEAEQREATRRKLVQDGFAHYFGVAHGMLEGEQSPDPQTRELVAGVRCFGEACLLKYQDKLLGDYAEEAGLGGGVLLLLWRKKQREATERKAKEARGELPKPPSSSSSPGKAPPSASSSSPPPTTNP